MRYFIIDRFEGEYAICEDKDRKMFAIEKKEISKEAKEGDVLIITDEGEISVDKEKTEQRKKLIAKKQNSLWK